MNQTDRAIQQYKDDQERHDRLMAMVKRNRKALATMYLLMGATAGVVVFGIVVVLALAL